MNRQSENSGGNGVKWLELDAIEQQLIQRQAALVWI